MPEPVIETPLLHGVVVAVMDDVHGFLAGGRQVVAKLHRAVGHFVDVVLQRAGKFLVFDSLDELGSFDSAVARAQRTGHFIRRSGPG